MKYQGVRCDVVIAMGDVATQFVSGNREPLFGDTPLVYFANNRSTQGGANSTGIVVERNLAATLELVQTLQPEVTRVFVVTGAAAADKAFENLLRTQAKALESRLDLNANHIDWRQLRRWRIDEAGVPAGALVRFREPGIWDRYGGNELSVSCGQARRRCARVTSEFATWEAVC